MEKIEIREMLKMHVSAYLPFRLKEGLYKIKIGEKISSLTIANPGEAFWNPDGLLSDDLGRLWSFKEVSSFRPVESAKLYSSIATSEIDISDLNVNQANEDLTKSLMRRVKRTVKDEILPSMNKLVDVVRLENNVPFLSPIRIFHLRIQAVGPLGIEQLVESLNQEFRWWLKGDGESNPWYRRFPWSKYVHSVMTYDIPDEKLLISDAPLHLDTVLLTNAEHLFILGQYSSAVVMAHSAVDAMVSAFISAQFRLKGVGEENIKSFLINNGLPNKLDLVLKLLFDFDIKSDNNLWESFSKMNSLRNDIVHNGVAASDLEAEKAIETSKKITELIKRFFEGFA